MNYQLGVKANVRMSTTVDSFSMESTYVLSKLGANQQHPELTEYLLEEQEVKLTNYADPNTYQLLEYVNRLASILSRQHLCIDQEGAIRGLLNLPEIKGKWEILKRELMKMNPVAAFEIVKQKDRELAHPAELIDNMANAHFMSLFGQGYGALHQTQESFVREGMQRDRLGIGVQIPVLKTFQCTPSQEGKLIQVLAAFNPKKKIDKSLLVQVTGHERIDVKHDSRAEFCYAEDNTLLYASQHLFEQLNDEYAIDLYLDLKCHDQI